MKKMAIAVLAALLIGVVMAKVGFAAKIANGAKNGSRVEHVERAEGSVFSTKPQAACNLSKAKRERLIAELGEIRAFLEKSAGADTNALRLLQFAAEVEREVRGKKYGLVFEEHRERVDEELQHNVPVLTEVKERFVDGGKSSTQSRRDAEAGGPQTSAAETDAQECIPPINFLVEGDNLAALKLLEKTHRGKIDLIYIDPPYNTGNKDFIYNDSYVDKTDTFRHSKWLSFMQKRLEIARRLMSDKGVIFISLNDVEQPACRVMCDSIFGEGNFCGQIIWRKKSGGGQTDAFFVTEHEYVLVYQKSSRFEWLDDLIESDAGFNKEDDGGVFKAVKLEKWGSSAHKEDRLTMWFPIRDPDGKKLYPKAPDGLPGRWRVGLKRMQDLEKRCLIHWEKKDGRWIPYEKIYSEDGNLTKIKKLKCRSIFYDEVGETGDATETLTEIFGKKDVFSNPKPVYLIEELLTHAKADVVLDFFAGSGTTGHAVMKLNAEDGGRRKFILVTNNENGICEKVTYERLKRVIERDKYAAALKYLKVDYIPIDGKVYYDYADDLLKHIRELVELENAIDFRSDSTIAIAVTDKEFERFVASERKMEGKKALYVGHDVLIGKAARQKLERRGVEIRIIPQYYYSEQEA